MLSERRPNLFSLLVFDKCIAESDIIKTSDGFFFVFKSVSSILSEKGILDFKDSGGERLECSRFFDDWFIYAVSDGDDYIYSLLKLREQEHDAEDGSPADGDTPGVTVSFISFSYGVLLDCLADPSEENRIRLSVEINRVVVSRGQRHHKVLKGYFKSPLSEGAYLIAETYTRHVASLASEGWLEAPECYKDTVQRSKSYKSSAKLSRLPKFIDALNREAGYVVCDNEKIYIKNPEEPTVYEAAAVLATHTGNTSVYSFAAEVEYHARFLTSLAKIKIPFFGRSIYDSAIRADMTVGDNEFEGPAPFHQSNSKIVKRQYAIHREESFLKKIYLP